ncbi:MAG: efflux transporter periplasmic adaptor subunit [Betaproteobacteria bacterium HGW-Betaproteobacteria-7]|jgi:multidrug efflux system membrane fusion protein|nr:MAG: efflux transporter periplasmic adaptor subunit [Betaproteobacteria bacterium HGW-Betaproteobacteria-7]
MPHRKTRFVLAAAIAGLFAAGGGLAIYHGQAGAAPAAMAPSAATVDVAEVASRAVTEWQQYSGRLEAVERVEIHPQVSGILTAVHFKDGSLVRKGELLFTIDPRPFAAEVARAEAQLAAMEARVAYTASDLARGERLLAENAIARRDFDEKQNAAREAKANLQAARAALKVAQLNLDYTRITAPIAGRVSRAEVTVGNLVAPDSGPVLTSLVSADRIYAAFDVDEQSYLKVVNGAQGQALPVDVGLADEDGYSLQGRLSSVDNRLDSSSGTIRLRALVDNPDGRLLPGLYARVRLGGASQRQVLLIDEKAVGTDQAKRFVLVVGDNNQTAYREVQLGSVQEGLRIVESGLKAGERIVVNGLQRVRPGDPVTPNSVPMGGAAAAADKS